MLSSLKGGLNGGAVGVTDNTLDESLAIKVKISSSSDGS
jgi:hypothetical protein